METAYKKQVSLLLDVLPEVAKESCFALHGGTAINLFVRNMPRLSADIDLTYVPIEDRNTSIANINQALLRIKNYIEAIKVGVRIVHQDNVCKLQVSMDGAQIKIEVNIVGRGALESPQKYSLCDKAQQTFDAYCSMSLVSIGQLYGGKICAALDRQHPRDLFDVKLLLENEGFAEQIKQGFLLGLISSDRPMHELLMPRLQDQRLAFENQFVGMTDEPFTYDDYESVRHEIIKEVRQSLTEQDKSFLVSVNSGNPDWHIYAFDQFPAVQWKLQNLNKLINANPNKHQEQSDSLHKTLSDEG